MEPEAGTPNRVGQLDWLLDDLVRRVAHITKAVILSQDGMTLGTSDTLERDDAEHLAALAAGFQSLARGACQHFGGGAARQTVIEMEAGFLLVTAAGSGTCLAVITAAGAAHTQLRQLAQEPGAGADLEAASRAALTDARLYEVRERLFIDASPAVAGAGQAMFERLRGLRRTVAAGAALSSPAFHDAYHPYIEAVWAYRIAVRGELEGGSLSPAVFGWTAWDGRERCPLCRPDLVGTR